ncbi:MAG: esterase [Clostridia bacterium]|nr:esterase [Clostridia bacterium]
MKTLTVGGRRVALHGDETAPVLLLQPVMREETVIPGPFRLAAFEVEDWNRELSPWPAPPVFGREGFGEGAADTLTYVTDCLLPALAPADTVVLGGYSLAGLFALWAGCLTDRFAAVAAVSPSVWFPGWLDWAAAHPMRAGRVYLSLGDREEKTRNPVMATVGEAIRATDRLLTHCDHLLEWNPGGHFDHPAERMARGFEWAAKGAYAKPL